MTALKEPQRITLHAVPNTRALRLASLEMPVSFGDEVGKNDPAEHVMLQM
jgi:hypothetical protein